MPNFTKRAIQDAFLQLLAERPLNQITVKDVVERCGINRNSFYYHYEGLPALLDEIIAGDLRQVMERHPTVASLEEGFDAVVEFVRERRRMVLHIYNSLSRDVFERYLMKVCQYVVETYLDAVLAERSVDEEDRAVVLRYHKCVCFGLVIDWLNGGMKDDLSAYVHRVYQLKIGWTPAGEKK